MFAWTMYGALLHRVKMLSEARTALERALAISPESSIARFLLAMLELDEGRSEAALALAHHAGESYRQAATAMAEYSLGHERESLLALDELKAKFATGFAFQIAQVHAWRGDRDATFEWLDRAYVLRDSGLPRLRGDWGFDKVKDDPRYAALIRKLGFPE
jgi:tetratricopeptide (TPR) repeat protein